MKSQPALTTTQDATVQAAFTDLRATAYPKVASVVRGRGLPDEDAVLTQVWVRAWPAFPPMHRREQDALAAGHPSPHHWDAWFCQIARRLVVDELRRLKTVRRRPLHRAAPSCLTNQPPGSQLTAPPIAMEPPGFGPHEVPLEDHHRADPDAFDPALLTERAALRAVLATGLASLPPKQRAAITMWADRHYDSDVAHAIGVSRYTLYRLRDRAISHLRATFHAHGYDVPTTGARW